MDDVVDVVRLHHPAHVLVGHHIRHVGHHLVHKLAGLHHGKALGVVHHGCRALGRANRDVVVHADDEMCADGTALAEGIDMAVVHHVEGAVHPDAHLPLGR